MPHTSILRVGFLTFLSGFLSSRFEGGLGFRAPRGYSNATSSRSPACFLLSDR